MSKNPERLLDEHLADVPVIAILRARGGRHLQAVIRTLVDCGIRAVEVTAPTPGSWDAVAEAAGRYGRSVSLGFGTVLTTDDVERAASFGGDFIVTPHTDPKVIRAARQQGIAALPGAFTPTEVVAAADAGASAVKIFPARTLGPAYIADVLAPLPDIKLVPVGGVELDGVASYLAAGAYAVGVGGPLIGTALADGDVRNLAHRATGYVDAARHSITDGART